MKEVNVYFVSDGEYIKIGISNNLKSRLSGIQTGNAKKLSLEHSISCDDYRQAQALEKILHEHFSSFHVSGEWFKLSIEDILNAPLKELEGESQRLDEARLNALRKRAKPEPPQNKVIKETIEQVLEEEMSKQKPQEPKKLLQVIFDSYIELDLIVTNPNYAHYFEGKTK